jgi:hypothetical protein
MTILPMDLILICFLSGISVLIITLIIFEIIHYKIYDN